VGLPGELAKVGFVAADYSLLEFVNLRNSTFWKKDIRDEIIITINDFLNGK
jgi:hypothetical protein